MTFSGVVIHPSAKIGVICTIFQQVTIDIPEGATAVGIPARVILTHKQ
jgi:serine acetyltransferase